MADVALRPAFAQADMDRLRQQRLTSIAGSRRSEQHRRTRLRSACCMERPIVWAATIGTARALRTLSAADLRAFYAARYRPDNATLVVVGDVTAAAVPCRCSKKNFGGWKVPAGPAARNSPRLHNGRSADLVDKPGCATVRRSASARLVGPLDI